MGTTLATVYHIGEHGAEPRAPRNPTFQKFKVQVGGLVASVCSKSEGSSEGTIGREPGHDNVVEWLVKSSCAETIERLNVENADPRCSVDEVPRIEQPSGLQKFKIVIPSVEVSAVPE